MVSASLKYLLALLLTPVVWISGFRRSVIRRNSCLLKLHETRVLRWKLAFCASRDLAALVLGKVPKIQVDSRTQAHLNVMKKSPSLLLTAHYHNWEFLGSELRKRGIPLLAAAQPLKTSWAERCLQGFRKRIGVAVISSDVPRAALRHLQQSGCFGLLWDQHSLNSDYSGSFFGLRVNMNPLPIFLMNHHSCPVYFGVLLPSNKLRLIRLLFRFDGNWEEKLIRRYHRALELLIRKHPELWYGFYHARFKNIAFYPGHRPTAKTILVPV